MNQKEKINQIKIEESLAKIKNQDSKDLLNFNFTRKKGRELYKIKDNQKYKIRQ